MTLDAAWAAVEATLPLQTHVLIATYPHEHRHVAAPYHVTAQGWAGKFIAAAGGQTLAAALLALAEKLRAQR